MRILLTNDDGFDAPGIQSLYKILSREHEVWVVAPDSNKSGTSSSFNFSRPSRLYRKGERLYALEGTPVDCVMTVYKGDFFPILPDMVISGINNGGNMGPDIIYSGTCGAARQGALYDIPSVALSMEKKDWNDPSPYYFDELSEFVLKNLDVIYEIAKTKTEKEYVDISTGKTYKRMYFLNINAPSIPEFKGVKWASLCKKAYNDSLVLEEGDGYFETHLIFGQGSLKQGDEKMDCGLVDQGYVALSLVKCIPDAYENSSIDLDARFKL